MEELVNIVQLPCKLPLTDGEYSTINSPQDMFNFFGYRQLKSLGQGGFGYVLLVDKLVPIGDIPKDDLTKDHVVTLDPSAPTMDGFVRRKMACKIIVVPDDDTQQSVNHFQNLK